MLLWGTAAAKQRGQQLILTKRKAMKAFASLILGSTVIVALTFSATTQSARANYPVNRAPITPAAAIPLILAQAADADLCRRRCAFDYDTCIQTTRRLYQTFPSPRVLAIQQDNCRTSAKMCIRDCDRP
jgi:hypothetical protein